MMDELRIAESLTDRQVRALIDVLERALVEQARSARVSISSPVNLEPDGLKTELEKFRTWFDPTAKGERLRTEIGRLQPTAPSPVIDAPPEFLLPVGSNKAILTPEGYLALWVWSRALAHREITGPIKVDEGDEIAAETALLQVYRRWTRRRIEDVVGLLTSETSTLRPAAAGLLFTLLVNRNTAEERALRRPREQLHLEQVADAIAAPALAFAETLGGRKTSRSAVDLYRGWALGELRRRLGPGFHSNLDEGIWLEPAAVQGAVERLVADVRRRDTAGRGRVPLAIEAALAAYDQQRPRLAVLNLAFDRPGDTERLRTRLVNAMSAEGDEDR